MLMYFGQRSARPAVLLTALALVILIAINPVAANIVVFGASPGSVRVTAGGSVSTTLTLTQEEQWVGQGLLCSGLPAGASCSSSLSFPIPIPASPPAASFIFTVTISTSPSTPPGTYTVTVVLTHTMADLISPGFAVSPGVSKTSASGGIGPVSISIQQFPAVSTDVTLTIDPAVIPEYPLGLPLLAAFMIVGYGLIRRRTKVR